MAAAPGVNLIRRRGGQCSVRRKVRRGGESGTCPSEQYAVGDGARPGGRSGVRFC